MPLSTNDTTPPSSKNPFAQVKFWVHTYDAHSMRAMSEWGLLPDYQIATMGIVLHSKRPNNTEEYSSHIYLGTENNISEICAPLIMDLSKGGTATIMAGSKFRLSWFVAKNVTIILEPGSRIYGSEDIENCSVVFYNPSKHDITLPQDSLIYGNRELEGVVETGTEE